MVCKQTEVSNMKIKDEQTHKYFRNALLLIMNRLYRKLVWTKALVFSKLYVIY